MLSQRTALRLGLLTLAGGLLAACDGGGSIVRAQSPQISRASGVVDGQPAFVGRWAASAADCGRTAWTMTAARLQSPGALACSVSQVTPTMAGYTAYSGCSTGGADMPGRVVMTLSGGPPPAALTLTGGPFAEPVSLVRCPA